MARFWILLLIVWYKACTVVHTKDIQLPNDQITSQEASTEDHKSNGENDDTYYNKDRMSIEELLFTPTMQKEPYDWKLGNLIYEIPDGFEPNNNLFKDSMREKREFRAWGGKRNIHMDEDPGVSHIFYGWKGKRAQDPYYTSKIYSLPYLNNLKLNMKKNDKVTWNSWGGKRTYNDISSPTNGFEEYVDYYSPLYDSNIMERKKSKFGSWGGKRSDDSVNEILKKNFLQWKGK